MSPHATAPRFQSVGYVHREGRHGKVLAGRWGTSPNREGRLYATSRDSHRHRLHKLDAYAISVDVLDQLTELDVERVLVLETDTDRVLEYELEDFTTWGQPVPDRYLHSTSDPQRYHDREDALHVWRDHASKLAGQL